MATKEDKIVVKQFKDKSSWFWVDNKVYCLDKDNSILFICGGKEDEKETAYFKDYVKRNKKSYVPREESIFDQEEIEYTKIGFGKYSTLTTKEVVESDKRYAGWLYENTTNNTIKYIFFIRF